MMTARFTPKISYWVILNAIIVLTVAFSAIGAYADEPLSTMLGGKTAPASNIKKIYVPELVTMMHDKKMSVIIFDVNPDSTRAKYGIIPGARLLSSAGSYDIARDLPPQKNAVIVFYCSNRH